jgi:uncharacterized protein
MGVEGLRSVTPQDPSSRIGAIDILRGIALFGVLMVNLITEFRVDVFQQFISPAPPMPMLDRFVVSGVSIFFELKAFALFSFLFGVGLAIQFDRLAKTSRRFQLLVRRLVVLLAFGLIHIFLIWNGDILTQYALLGLIALPMLYLSNVWLVTIAVLLLAFYTGLPHSLPADFFWPSTEWLQEHVDQANRVYATGTYLEITRFSWNETSHIASLLLCVAPRTLALFLLGAVAWRTGLLSQSERHKRLLLVLMSTGLLIGGALSFFEAMSSDPAWARIAGGIVNVFPMGPVMLAMGYMAAVISLVSFTRARTALRIIGPLGRMAFTSYIMQSLIFCTIFYGYGLGLFGRLGAFVTLIIGITVYALQIVVSMWWLRRYRFGPLEWLWRTLMYGTRQPLVLSKSA